MLLAAARYSPNFPNIDEETILMLRNLSNARAKAQECHCVTTGLGA
jgi:hypothetical protein